MLQRMKSGFAHCSSPSVCLLNTLQILAHSTPGSVSKVEISRHSGGISADVCFRSNDEALSALQYDGFRILGTAMYV